LERPCHRCDTEKQRARVGDGAWPLCFRFRDAGALTKHMLRLYSGLPSLGAADRRELGPVRGKSPRARAP
jgi:hypothetical protein